jgi:hypothetical protein
MTNQQLLLNAITEYVGAKIDEHDYNLKVELGWKMAPHYRKIVYDRTDKTYDNLAKAIEGKGLGKTQ